MLIEATLLAYNTLGQGDELSIPLLIKKWVKEMTVGLFNSQVDSSELTTLVTTNKEVKSKVMTYIVIILFYAYDTLDI